MRKNNLNDDHPYFKKADPHSTRLAIRARLRVDPLSLEIQFWKLFSVGCMRTTTQVSDRMQCKVKTLTEILSAESESGNGKEEA